MNKKFNIMIKKIYLILTFIYWQTSFEKYVPKHLISFLYKVYFIFHLRYLLIKKKKNNAQNVSTQMDDFVFKLSEYSSHKRFIGLKWFIQIFSTILHFQFNYHTLPVNPFKDLQKVSCNPLFTNFCGTIWRYIF